VADHFYVTERETREAPKTRPNHTATEAGPKDSDDMSIEIAAELREEVSMARKGSERLSSPDDSEVLALLAPDPRRLPYTT
jgi:hypothetical protein